MFQNTPYTSPKWLLAIYIPSISVARLPLLHGRSCISGFDTLFSMALLTDGKRDFFVALICLSRLLGWPKRAYAFFPEYIQYSTVIFKCSCLLHDYCRRTFQKTRKCTTSASLCYKVTAILSIRHRQQYKNLILKHYGPIGHETVESFERKYNYSTGFTTIHMITQKKTLFFFLIYFWLCWVFVSVRGLSLVAASGGHSSSPCAGLSCCGAQAPDAQAQ